MTESGPSRALAPLNRALSVERAYCRRKAEVCCELQVTVKPAARTSAAEQEGPNIQDQVDEMATNRPWNVDLCREQGNNET
jgi:hypothetical protein